MNYGSKLPHFARPLEAVMFASRIIDEMLYSSKFLALFRCCESYFFRLEILNSFSHYFLSMIERQSVLSNRFSQQPHQEKGGGVVIHTLPERNNSELTRHHPMGRRNEPKP